MKATLVGIAGSHHAFSLSLYNLKAYAYRDSQIRKQWEINVIQRPLIGVRQRDKLLSELSSGLEELRNGMPLNQRFEILMKDEGASFKVGNTKGDIFVRISGASFEMKTKKGRGGDTSSFEYFSLQDLLQAGH